MGKRLDLTQGVIWRGLTAFFFPILLGAFFQQLYNAVDALVVGNLVGKQALAAVGGSASQAVNLSVGFFTGLANGGTVILAHYVGAQNRPAMRRALHTALAFALLGGVVLTALGLLLARPALRWMHTPEDTMAYSLQYLRIVFCGALPSLVYNMGGGILRAMGDSRRPVLYLVICCASNIVLDLAFVALLHLDVVGVAVATVLSQVLSAVLILRALSRLEPDCRFRVRELALDRTETRHMLTIGLPSAVQSSMYSLTNLFLQVAVNGLGTDVVAAWTTSSKTDSIYWMTMNAFGATILTFVGQNFGAGNTERMRRGIRVWMRIALIAGVTISALLFCFARHILILFNRDPVVLELGVTMVRCITPLYFTWVFIEIFSNVLRGMGDSVRPTLIVIAGICVLRVLWVFVVVPHYPSVPVICACYPITWVVTGTWLTLYYWRYRKRHQEQPLDF